MRARKRSPPGPAPRSPLTAMTVVISAVPRAAGAISTSPVEILTVRAVARYRCTTAASSRASLIVPS